MTVTQSHLLLCKRDRQQVGQTLSKTAPPGMVLQAEATVRSSPSLLSLLSSWCMAVASLWERASTSWMKAFPAPEPTDALIRVCYALAACHIIGEGAVCVEVERLYRHPMPLPCSISGGDCRRPNYMWHEMVVKTRGSLWKSVSLHFGKHLIVHFVFNDRDRQKSAQVLIPSRSWFEFDSSQRVELSLTPILIHVRGSHCRQCTGGHLRGLWIKGWLYINAASFSKLLSHCMCECDCFSFTTHFSLIVLPIKKVKKKNTFWPK